MIPACVIAGIDAFGSSCRVTTCQRNSPLPACRPDERGGADLEQRGAQDPHRHGRDADPERDRGQQRRLDRADRVALERDVSLRRKHVELDPERMISAIPITNVGIAIPIAAKAERTALRIRFGQIAPATRGRYRDRESDHHRHEREQQGRPDALADQRRDRELAEVGAAEVSVQEPLIQLTYCAGTTCRGRARRGSDRACSGRPP